MSTRKHSIWFCVYVSLSYSIFHDLLSDVSFLLFEFICLTESQKYFSCSYHWKIQDVFVFIIVIIFYGIFSALSYRFTRPILPLHWKKHWAVKFSFHKIDFLLFPSQYCSGVDCDTIIYTFVLDLIGIRSNIVKINYILIIFRYHFPPTFKVIQ